MSGVGHAGRRHRHAPAAGRCLESAARRWSALHRPGQPGRGLLAVKHPIREVLPAVGVERLDDAGRLVPPPGLRHAVEGGRADVVHGVDHDERGRLVALVDVDDRRVEATATSLCSCAASICASRSALSRARREFSWTCSLRRFLLDAAGDDQPQSFRCVQSKDFEKRLPERYTRACRRRRVGRDQPKGRVCLLLVGPQHHRRTFASASGSTQESKGLDRPQRPNPRLGAEEQAPRYQLLQPAGRHFDPTSAVPPVVGGQNLPPVPQGRHPVPS